MADRSPDVRRSAATILGWERYHPAAPALAILLKDEDREVRRAAVQALGALQAEQSVYSLIRALEDEDGQVRLAARDALSRTVPIPIELDVDEEPEVLFPKIEGLIRWWVDARVEGSLREC
jgi:HEAT repeat protein